MDQTNSSLETIDYKLPYHVLNISTADAVNQDFNLEAFRQDSDQVDNPVAIWLFEDNAMYKILNKSWLERLRDSGLPVACFLLFYRQPYYVHPGAHVDLKFDLRPDVHGLNWVISPDDDSYMTWYDVPLESGMLLETPAKTKYLSWNLDDVADKEIARHIIGNNLTLVRTSIAHNVIVNSRPRWLVSLRFSGDFDKQLNDWPTAVDFYHRLNLIKQ